VQWSYGHLSHQSGAAKSGAGWGVGARMVSMLMECVLQWASGQKYEGSWREDMRSGIGTESWTDGSHPNFLLYYPQA